MATKIDFGSVSYSLGILSIVFAFFSPFVGLVLGIIGYIQSNKKNVGKARKFNIIGIIISAIFIILLIVMMLFFGEELNTIFP